MWAAGSPARTPTACSTHSLPQKRRALGWDYASVAGLSNRMVAACGRASIPDGARPFISLCLARHRHPPLLPHKFRRLTRKHAVEHNSIIAPGIDPGYSEIIRRLFGNSRFVVQTGQVRSRTHMDGYRVYQELQDRLKL